MTIRVVDGGGNGLRRADLEGRVLFNHAKTLGPVQSVEELLDFVCAGLPDCTKGISFAIAGLIKDHQTMIQSPNIPFLNGINLAGVVKGRCGLQARAFNDMDGAGAGMNVLCARNLRFFERFMALTISSGIGGRILQDGKIINQGAEMSHFVIDKTKNAPLCGCGLCGCVESLAGGEAVKRLVWDKLGGPNIKINQHPMAYLDQGFDAGADWAKQIYLSVADTLARFFATTLTTIGYQAVVYKGTFAQALFPRVEDEIRRKMQDYLMLGMRPQAESLQFVPSPDPINDSLYGAADLFSRLMG